MRALLGYDSHRFGQEEVSPRRINRSSKHVNLGSRFSYPQSCLDFLGGDESGSPPIADNGQVRQGHRQQCAEREDVASLRKSASLAICEPRLA